MSRFNKHFLWIGVLLLALALVAPTAQAAEPRTGERVTIAANETVNDDVYLFGSDVIVDGTVHGDVVTAAQTVIINGTVDGSVWAAGSSITVNGHVGHSVRAAGYAINVGPEATIGRDIMSAGYSIMAAPGSLVQGDLLAASYQARLGGTIGRDYRGSQNALELNGTVKGNVNVTVDAASGDVVNPAMFMPNMPADVRQTETMTPGFRIGDQAQVAGELVYHSNIPAVVAPAAQLVGGIQQFPNEAAARQQQAAQQAAEIAASPTTRLLDFLRQWVTLLIIGGLLVWLAWAITRHAADFVATRPLPSFGWGLVTLIGVPLVLFIIAVVSFILLAFFGVLTLGGLAAFGFVGGILTAGALLFAFYTAVAWVSKVIVGLAIGRLLLARLAPQWSDSRVWPMVIGVSLVAIVLALLGLIPFVGGLFSLLITIVGLGALALTIWSERGRLRPAQALPAPAPVPAR